VLEWTSPPDHLFRLAKYLLGPPGVVLFLPAIPLLWLAPRRIFRPLLLVISIALVVLSWGTVFTSVLLVSLAAGYPLATGGVRMSALTGFIVIEAVYLLLFWLPVSHLPVLRDPRFLSTYPGLLTDRELVFYTGLAFTNLRLLHLTLSGRSGGGRRRPLTVSRYLLYLFYAPTYRLGPFITYDDFDAQLERAHERTTWSTVGRGFMELLLGAVIFEATVKTIDTWFFKRLGPDDGSYWYLWFFDRPPAPAALTLIGIYLSALRYYLLIKAYSHAASGLSRMIGVELPANMQWPLLSANVIEFWRRFHVTVSNFVQSHILVPVRLTAAGPAIGVAAAFAFTALWHRPALHTLVWAICQLAAIGVVLGWRRMRQRSAAVQACRRVFPAWLRRAAGVLLTLAFIAHTTPLLLDLRHGGAQIVRRLMSGPWLASISKFGY
jgi:D-alanyl-lipoteichoic acid acyltransferase DltB (MBOAT superfamily)